MGKPKKSKKHKKPLILQYLNKYPSPVGVNANMVSPIRHKLDELQRMNQQIETKSAGWLVPRRGLNI